VDGDFLVYEMREPKKGFDNKTKIYDFVLFEPTEAQRADGTVVPPSVPHLFYRDPPSFFRLFYFFRLGRGSASVLKFVNMQEGEE